MYEVLAPDGKAGETRKPCAFWWEARFHWMSRMVKSQYDGAGWKGYEEVRSIEACGWRAIIRYPTGSSIKKDDSEERTIARGGGRTPSETSVDVSSE